MELAFIIAASISIILFVIFSIFSIIVEAYEKNWLLKYVVIIAIFTIIGTALSVIFALIWLFV